LSGGKTERHATKKILAVLVFCGCDAMCLLPGRFNLDELLIGNIGFAHQVKNKINGHQPLCCETQVTRSLSLPSLHLLLTVTSLSQETLKRFDNNMQQHFSACCSTIEQMSIFLQTQNNTQ